MKEENSHQIKSSLNNIYLKKTVKEIANSLEPRYTNLTPIKSMQFSFG